MAIEPTKLGALACQRDSKLQQLTTTVVACEPAPARAGVFEVVLADTVLFPEGGGQPHDRGWISEVEVERVIRQRGRCVHVVREPLTVGATVDVRVDWVRRFDHMQQHSGQHLLSAVTQALHGWRTTSWSLGEDVCHVELDTKAIAADQMAALERAVNARVREARAIRQRAVAPDELAATRSDNGDGNGSGDGNNGGDNLKPATRTTVTAKEADFDEAVLRVIEIDGVDACTCCGTHLDSTAEMQAFKFLGTAPMRGHTRLMFVVGGRVLQLAGVLLANEAKLVTLLSCGRAEHADAVKRIQASASDKRKEITQLNDQLARRTADDLRRALDTDCVVVHYRGEGESADEFVFLAAKHLLERLGVGEVPGAVVLLTSGAINGAGGVTMVGDPAALETAGPRVMAAVEGKGAQGKSGAKRAQFQGKAKRLLDAGALKAVLTSDAC